MKKILLSALILVSNYAFSMDEAAKEKRTLWASPHGAPTVREADVKRLVEVFGEAIAECYKQKMAEMNEEEKADYIQKMVEAALEGGSGNPWRAEDILSFWLWG
jgi:hypothetical protein